VTFYPGAPTRALRIRPDILAVGGATRFVRVTIAPALGEAHRLIAPDGQPVRVAPVTVEADDAPVDVVVLASDAPGLLDAQGGTVTRFPYVATITDADWNVLATASFYADTSPTPLPVDAVLGSGPPAHPDGTPVYAQVQALVAQAATERAAAQAARTDAQTARTDAQVARDAALAQNFRGLDLATTDLNTVLTPGLYRQATGSNATAPRNYPPAVIGAAGVLEVLNVLGTGDFCVQRFTAQGAVAGFTRNVYQRRWNGSVWSAWVSITSTRVDKTAGIAVYAWDDVAAREQLVYADTGQRDVTALFADVASGTVLLSRTLYTVTLSFVNTQFSDASASLAHSYQAALPASFRPINAQRIALPSGINNAGLVTAFTNGDLSLVKGTTLALYNELSFKTNAAWPSSLPGTASGTIPNL
jgi:hypothetical protein